LSAATVTNEIADETTVVMLVCNKSFAVVLSQHCYQKVLFAGA